MGVAERKEREFRRREREILDAAARLFESDDWQQVSIDRIAQEAEIGKGTVYLHFPSKEAIFGRLTLEFARGILERLRAIDAGLPPTQRLGEAIRIFFDAHLQRPSQHRIVEHCSLDEFRRRVDDGTRSELQAVDDQIFALIHGILHDGIRAGVFPDRPVETMLIGAHATVIGALRLLAGGCPAMDGPADPQSLVPEVTRFVLAGLMHFDRVPDEVLHGRREPSTTGPPVARM